MVIDQFATTTGEDRRPVGQARPVLLAVAGGEPSDATVVWKHGAADRGAADGIGSGGGQANRSKVGREGQVSEKSLQDKAFSGFPLPGRGWTRPFLSHRSRLRLKRARAKAFGCIVFGTQDAKTEILALNGDSLDRGSYQRPRTYYRLFIRVDISGSATVRDVATCKYHLFWRITKRNDAIVSPFTTEVMEGDTVTIEAK